MTRWELTQDFARKLNRAHDTVNDWKAKLDNPAYAFEWADSAIEAAGQTAVLPTLIRQLANTEDFLFEDILADAEHDLIRWAGGALGSSTSVSTNAVNKAKLKALAEAVEALRAVETKETAK